MYHSKNRKNSANGFTLIELMIVISIIGIIASIAIPNYISYRDKAYCSAAENDAKGIIGILANYFSVPGRNSFIVPVNITANAVNGPQLPINGIRYTELSGNNVATITGLTIDQLTITVIDGSGRCPAKYQTSDPQWFNGKYIKTF